METNRCYGCFREKDEGQGGPCPHCGYDPAADQGKYPFALPHGSILAGQFITGRVLGQGGFGITYLAKDIKLDTKVAIKEFLPDSMAVRASGDHQVTVYTGQRQENFRYGMDRFLDEARVLAKFQGNPGIVGVRSYFEENGTAYFVMDYIEGDSFKTYIQNQGGKVSWEEAVRILTPVMDALGAVHREGIIHRDVTPDNIVLTSDGSVRLLDFGSARYSLGDKSKSLDVVLKAGYAPKEQYIRRGKQGPYTDVYSLAACFYAAITGYLPPEALERMDEDELIPPSTRGIKLPSGLEDAILKGLEVQPGDRYQSMEEFHAALDSALREETVIPGPVPGPIPDPAPDPISDPVPGPIPDPAPDPVLPDQDVGKTSFMDRIKALPRAVKGGAAAAACLVVVLGALAGSGVFSGGRPSPIDSGGSGSVQSGGTVLHTVQDGGVNPLEGTEADAASAEDAAVKQNDETASGEQEAEETQAVATVANEETDAAEKAAAEKAAAEKAAAEKAAAEKAAAEKAAAEKAAAEKAAAEKAAAEKAAAEKAAAEKAAAEKAAAEKAAAEKAAAEKAATPTKSELKASADKYEESQEWSKAADCYRQMNKLGYITKSELGKELHSVGWNAYYHHKEYSVAKTLWTEASDLGSAQSTYWIGNMYYYGKGVEKNKTTAFEWYLKSANQGGYASAYFNVGLAYEYGDGTSKNKQEALKWYEKHYEATKYDSTKKIIDKLKSELGISTDSSAAATAPAESEAPAVTKVTNQAYTMVTSKFSVSGTYTGEWKDGKPNGEGTMTMTQSDERWDKGDTLYSAKWVNGLIEGYGQWRSAVDGAYDGNFSKGLKSGKGKMWFSDGTVYDGQWSGGDFIG